MIEPCLGTLKQNAQVGQKMRRWSRTSPMACGSRQARCPGRSMRTSSRSAHERRVLVGFYADGTTRAGQGEGQSSGHHSRSFGVPQQPRSSASSAARRPFLQMRSIVRRLANQSFCCRDAVGRHRRWRCDQNSSQLSFTAAFPPNALTTRAAIRRAGEAIVVRPAPTALTVRSGFAALAN
jgi:hypothetical protein